MLLSAMVVCTAVWLGGDRNGFPTSLLHVSATPTRAHDKLVEARWTGIAIDGRIAPALGLGGVCGDIEDVGKEGGR